MVYAPPARHLLRAKDLADARFAEPLDVAELARAAGLSPAHFSREFRRAFGESPHGYLLTRRLERAAALLRSTDRSVADICFSVGLQSVGLVHHELHAHVRQVAHGLPCGVPTGRAPSARAALRDAGLRPPATPHVSRRQPPGPGLASWRPYRRPRTGGLR
jgi:AraC-like DNA-binding protein